MVGTISGITAKDINAMLDMNDFEGIILGIWGESGEEILEEIRNSKQFTSGLSSFMRNCTGYDWNGVILTGLEKLYPNVYAAIPEEMGKFGFTGLVCVLNLLGINTADA